MPIFAQINKILIKKTLNLCLVLYHQTDASTIKYFTALTDNNSCVNEIDLYWVYTKFGANYARKSFI